MTQQVWKQKTKNINLAVLFYCILIMVDGLLDLYQYVQIMNDVSRSNGLGDMIKAIFGSVGPEDIIIVVLLFASYVWLINTIKGFGAVQDDEQTRLSLEQVGGAMWLNFAASVVALIPFFGLTSLIALIMEIVSYAKMMSAFRYMMNSPVFNAQARSGAGTLKSYSIWSIWGLVPFIGGFCRLVAWFQFIRGWLKVGRGASVERVASQPQINISIKNKDYQEQAGAIPETYLHKAQAKTDDELKSIIQHKDDYNQQLVKAAERVLLDRLTGVSDDDKYKAYQPGASKEEDVFVSTKAAEESTAEKDSFVLGSKDLKQESKEESVQVNTVTEQKAAAELSLDHSSKNSNVIIFSILAGVLLAVGGALAYFLWYVPYTKDRDAPRMYVVANNVFLRSTRMAGVEYNIIGKVPYGTEVITYNILGDWAEVKVNELEGVIAAPYLLNSYEFILLNDTWGDDDTRDCIESSKCRLAILDYIKSNKISIGPYGWQVYTKPLGQKPNTVFYPRIYDKYSKYTDFVFIIKDNQTGNRVLVCYSFEDTTEKPIFRFSVDAPPTGCIKSVTPRSGGARVVFDDNSYLNITL